ncbi:MAG: hypothetical protein Q8O83_01360 [bacterium]|nr:hypothetical protein [bacterium]
MKENFSSIDRLYGKDVAAEERKEILSMYKKNFEDQVNHEAFQELLMQEREKTKEEIELIVFCNEKINALRGKYGLEPFTIPESNFHIVPMEKWKEGMDYEKSNTAAFFSNSLQGVAAMEIDNPLAFAKGAYHELIHFHGYQALMVAEREGRKLKDYDYRFGMGMFKERGEEGQFYFENMNEALTEELAKRFIENEYASENPHPLLQKGIQTIRNLQEEAKEKVSGSDLEKSITNPELYYALLHGRIGIDEDLTLGNQYFFSYKKQRSILNTLIDTLYEHNKENCEGREAIFDMFVKAHFTGNIYELGKMIDRSFGKGTFRKIGELDENIEEQEQFIKSL